MDFGKVLTRAWHIIWNNKIIWLFGIFASCGSQSRFSSSSNYSFDSRSFNGPRDVNLPDGLRQFFFNMERFFERTPDDRLLGIGLGILCLILVIALIAFLLSVLGRLSVIKGALRADAGEKLSFSQLWEDGIIYFGRGLVLNLLLALAVFVLGLLFAVAFALIGAFTFGIGLICLLPIICLLIPIGIAYGVYVELANVALVAEDLSVSEAFSRGWNVMRDNLGNIAIMALILVIGGGVLSFIFALPLAAVVVPAFIGFIVNEGRAFGTGLAISAGLLVVAIPLVILLSGILRSYIVSAWTLTYTELSGSAPAVIDAPPTKPKTPARKASAKKTARPKKSS
jgi:hypothetical protein